MLAVEIALLFIVIALTTLYEMAIFSARQEHMRLAAQEGDRRGTVVMTFLRNPTRIIAALQTLATGASIALGMLISVHISPQVVQWFPNDWPEGQAAAVTYAIVLTVSTLTIMLLTNLLPKKIGYVLADPISLAGAWPAKVLLWILSPIATLMGRISDGMLRLFRVRLPSAPAVREGDIRILLHQGRLRGTIDPLEMEIIKDIFRLSEITVANVMTPREDIAAVSDAWEVDRMTRFVTLQDHSYLLVKGETLDEIKGVIRAREILEPPVGIDHKDVKDVVELVPDMNLVLALEAFKTQTGKVAIVREGGQVVGMLTLNDIFSAMIHLSCLED